MAFRFPLHLRLRLRLKVRGGWSADRRNHCLPPPSAFALRHPRTSAGRALRRRWTRRRTALHRAAFLSPAPCFRGAQTAEFSPPSGAASAARRRPSVQPLKAAGHNAGGRLAGASRVRGYKPRPRAPPPPHVRQCPAERPSRGVTGDRNICFRN
jgi:hypothetical protein